MLSWNKNNSLSYLMFVINWNCSRSCNIIVILLTYICSAPCLTMPWPALAHLPTWNDCTPARPLPPWPTVAHQPNTDCGPGIYVYTNSTKLPLLSLIVRAPNGKDFSTSSLTCLSVFRNVYTYIYLDWWWCCNVGRYNVALCYCLLCASPQNDRARASARDWLERDATPDSWLGLLF